MTDAAQLPDTDYLQVLRDGWARHLEAEKQRPDNPEPRERIWASQRRKCVRRMALDLTHPGDQEKWKTDTLERFFTGDERENDIQARLIHVGKYAPIPFRVTHQQERFVVTFRRRKIISGKIDGRIVFSDGFWMPYETKSGDAARYIRRIEDFGRSDFTWHYLDQLLIGMDALGAPRGMFVCDRSGLPELIEVRAEDWRGRVKQFKHDAHRAAVAAAGLRDLPEHCDDVTLCKSCPHLHKSCSPPRWDEGHPETRLITDEETLQAIERRGELEESAKEYDRLDKKLKRDLRGTVSGIAGDFVLSGKWSPRTVCDLPEDVAAKIEKLRKPHERVEPRGSFRLRFERVVDGGGS